MTAYVALERREEGFGVCAARAEADAQSWPPASAGSVALRRHLHEFLAYVAEAERVLTYGAGPLVALLSEPALLRDARRCLGRLGDAQEAALLVAPTLADFSLTTLSGALALTPPDVTDPATFFGRWEALCARLCERLGRLPAGLAGALAAVAGPAWPTGPLGPPPRAVPPSGVIGNLLPRRPKKAPRVATPPVSSLQDVAERFLSPDGPLAVAHPHYEHRPGQIEMARAVAAAFEREEALLVEAGTGVGKSLAYLLSAIVWARTQGEPVVVSTNTKNLQDQLMRRDLPLAARTLDLEFTAALLKGRTNYLCPRLLAAATERVQASVFRDERLALAHLVAWAAAAEIADLEALSPMAYDLARGLREAVSWVRARTEGCPGRSCAYFQSCPVEVARARAQNADLVVANHALTLASSQTTVLPEHRCLILDEAHNLEDCATDQLGLEVSEASVRGLLRLLTGEGPAGPVDARLAEWLSARPVPDDAAVMEARTSLREPTAQVEYALEDLASAVMDFRDPRRRAAGEEPGRSTVRLSDEMRGSRGWQEVLAVLPPVKEATATVQEVLARFVELVSDCEGELCDTAAALLLDLEYLRGQVAQLQGALAIIVEGEESREYVCWAETWPARTGGLGWGLRAAPVDVGPALAQALYQPASTVILTSATLTVGGSFDYMRRRVGLESERGRLLELVVPSPFDFPRQLTMCVPTDLPLPNEPSFGPASHEAIFGAASAAGGGTLCLFTSRDSLTRAFEALAPRFADEGLELLGQDITGTRTALLEALRQNERAVLFGLKSFWEGVDVPGEALRCLVIAKLPFAVPSDPVVEARQERVEEEGLNGYDDFYVPNAIIGFRQGLGRLIRTKSDRGAVMILDRRVLLRNYGRRFLESAPPCRLLRAPLEECVDAVRSLVGIP